MAMSANEVAYQKAHIHDSKRVNIVASISALTALATAAIFLRAYVRWTTRLRFQADDYTIFAAAFVAWLLFATICIETQNGLGRHLIGVPENELIILFKGLLFAGPGFHLCTGLIQLSFVFLYKRIFTTQRPWFKYTLYFLGIFAIVQNGSIIITVMCYCVPFSFHWNKSIPGGHCYTFQVVYVVGLCVNLITDIAILAAPIPIIWGLHMSSKSKKALVGMFLLGGFLCITNLIRLPYTINIPPEDFTWTDVNAALWAQASSCIGIVSACLPCYRPLFKDMGFSTAANGPSAPNASRQSRSKVKTADTYKTLDGGEPSGKGSPGSSKIELVGHDQWKSSVPRNKTTALGPAAHEDVESVLSHDVIKVTRDIDVSSKEVQ